MYILSKDLKTVIEVGKRHSDYFLHGLGQSENTWDNVKLDTEDKIYALNLMDLW